jgi:hypothetical protein
VSTNYGGEGVDRVNNCADLEFGPRSFLSPLQIPVLLDEACEVKLGDKTQWTQEKVNDSVVIKMLYGKELLPAIVAFPDPELPGYFKKLVIYDRKGETGEEIFQSEETCSFDGSIRKCDETATSPLHGKFYSATASYRLLKKSNLKIGTRAYLQHQFAFDSGTAEWTADQFKYQATATSQGADTGRITVTLNRSVAPSKIDIEVKPSWLSTPFDLSGSDVREIRYVKTRKYDEQGRTTLVEITDLSGVKDEEIAPSEVFKRQFTFGTPSTSPPEHERKNPVISTDSKRVYYLDTAEIAKNLQETTGNDQYQFQARVSNWPAFGKAFANVDRGKRSIYYTDDCLYGLNVEGLPDGSGFIVQISDRPKPPDLKEHHTLAEIRDICLPASSNGLAIELVTIEGK